ncbi:PIN domain-containing protein [Gilbertella persicaria]|uniref:PIN domain-containing protein n=1 Tax=Gilbertella persicaria TaxID=101096 RepID=UPI0022207B67|nr:PIN domain-containing protein [Gilbertella persicaria]KAI8059379.1 PIN domain-containing protein [Gilbertella persicaria]
MNQEDMEFMDIDGPEFLNDVNNQIANIRATSRYDQIDNTNTAMFEQFDQQTPSFAEIAVLDTNFLLSKLGFLDALLDIANKYPGSLLVLLPWVVIRELDGLKGSRNDTDVCTSARKAMRFLELRLRDKMVSLRGQKMNEVFDKQIIHAGNAKGDDRILDCCM